MMKALLERHDPAFDRTARGVATVKFLRIDSVVVFILVNLVLTGAGMVLFPKPVANVNKHPARGLSLQPDPRSRGADRAERLDRAIRVAGARAQQAGSSAPTDRRTMRSRSISATVARALRPAMTSPGS